MSLQLKAYKSNNKPDVYILNYYALAGEPLYFEITTPYNNTTDVLEGFNVEYYKINLGDKIFYTSTESQSGIYLNLTTPGVYPVFIETKYKNGAISQINVNQAITIYDKWPLYNKQKYRILDQNNIKLPYTKEDVTIKPNEFGVSDVFNSSILKLNNCVEYLQSQSTAIYNKTPSLYIGWFGQHESYPSHKLKWYTISSPFKLSRDFNKSSSANEKLLYKLIDFKVVNNELYFINKTSAGTFKILYGTLQQNYESIILNEPVDFLSEIKNVQSLEVVLINKNTRALFILDDLGNKIYKVIIKINDDKISISSFVEQTIGGLGDVNTPTKFYSPTNIYYNEANNNLYVIDSNNKCIKQYTIYLGWVNTYFFQEFEYNTPISVTVDSNGVLTVVTETNVLYVIKNDSIINTINLNNNLKPIKILLNKTEEFYYILYNNFVSKYTILGQFVNNVDILPTNKEYYSLHIDKNHNIYIGSNNCILKFIDVVDTFSIITPAYSSLYWSKKELCVTDEEFVQDWAINRCLKRISHNVETFRKSIHSVYGVYSLYTAEDIVSFYTATPITSTELSLCGKEIEDLTVGANEFVLSQVINRSLEKIYNCIVSIAENFINIKQISNDACKEQFCWSWKSTACLNIKTPSLKICGINPISFIELESKFSKTYAKSNTWRDAFSSCCGEAIQPTLTPTLKCTPTITPTPTPTEPTLILIPPAGLIFPYMIAIDSSNNLYVSDASSTIRKITPTGEVTTFAGTAGFNRPIGITIDSSDNLYVCDGTTIRKITPVGVVTTFAGTAGSTGSTDGTGSAARFTGPYGITIDSSNNLFVSELLNHTIRKITSAGVVTTFAGTASIVGSTDGFNKPSGITIDSSDNLYVCDNLNHTIRKITSSGIVTTFAGTAGSSGSVDGTGTAARFMYPNGIAIDSSDNLYVSDSSNHTIRKITPAGVVTTFAGTAGSSGLTDGIGTDARFNFPRGITIDSSNNLYVCDTYNYRICKITSAGEVSTLSLRII